MRALCDIIIPVYNSPEWLELCVEAAIISDRSNVIGKIMLIDDCSREETQILIERLCTQYDKVISVRNTENLGFVKTCNRGMKLCSANYIMLLNSDCLLADDTTARMIEILQKNPKAGLICPLSNNAANLSIPIPEGTNYVQIDKVLGELPDKVYPACTIVGNCMLITKTCYDTVGGLDEAFGMGYGEETDYQFRSAEAGFEAIVAGNVYVFHKSQVSFGNSEKLSEQKQKNRELFFSRWGEAYKRMMEAYVKNDPAKDAEMYLNRNLNRLAKMKVAPFDAGFLERVRKIDGDTANEKTPTLFQRIKVKYKELGLCGFCKKVFCKGIEKISDVLRRK